MTASQKYMSELLTSKSGSKLVRMPATKSSRSFATPLLVSQLQLLEQWSNRFDNVRKEQGYGANRKIFRIICNAAYPCQTITFNNCATGEDATLWYLRNVDNALMNGGGIIATLAALSAGNYIVDCNVANTVKTMTWNGVRMPVAAANLKDAGLVAAAGNPIRTGWTLPFSGTWTV